jgi:hypothetical protein
MLTLAITLAQSGAHSGGPDWATIVEIPGAVVALGGMAAGVLYAFGILRPLAVQDAVFWVLPNGEFQFSCIVRGRSHRNTRTVTGMLVVTRPAAAFDRVFDPWRRRTQPTRWELWGTFQDEIKSGKLSIDRRDHIRLEGELRWAQSGDAPDDGPTPQDRIEARAGRRWARAKAFVRIEPAATAP